MTPARIHTHAPQCICPQCNLRWRECRCEFNQSLRNRIGDPPHRSRPWGYKGVQTLPDTHPDSPNFKAGGVV